MPETPNFVQLVPGGHGFAKNDYNDLIDIFGYESGYHNGPVCVFCHMGFCHHCDTAHETAACSQAPIVVHEKPKTKEVASGSQVQARQVPPSSKA